MNYYLLSQGRDRWVFTHTFETEQRLNLKENIILHSEWKDKTIIPGRIVASNPHDLHLKGELRDVLIWRHVNYPEMTAQPSYKMGPILIVSEALKDIILKFKTTNLYIYEMEIKLREKKYPFFLLQKNYTEIIDYDKTTFIVRDTFRTEGKRKVYEKDIKLKNRDEYKRRRIEYVYARKECIPYKRLYLNDNYDFFYNSEDGYFIISEGLKIAIEKANLDVDILELKKYTKLDFIAPNQQKKPKVNLKETKNIVPPPIKEQIINKESPKQTREYFLDDLRFTTQAEIDQFKLDYPDCTEIIGRVFINGDINNLEGLSQIWAINGGLYIMPAGDQLTSLSALSNLEVIGGELTIYNAHGLKNLNGLENLREVQSNGLFASDPLDRGVSIDSNHNLIDITALKNLKSTRFNLHVGFNPKLKSLKGLEGFEKVGRDLVIQGNASLADISAMGNLEEVVGNAIVYDNKSLNSLKGLEHLEKTTAVEITNNGSLPDFLDLATLKAYFE